MTKRSRSILEVDKLERKKEEGKQNTQFSLRERGKRENKRRPKTTIGRF